VSVSPIRPGEVVPYDPANGIPKYERSYHLTSLSTVQAKPITWLLPGRVPLGGVTVVAGAPGQGKSQLTLGIAAAVTRNADVILIGAEDGLADTVKPRLLAAGADVERVHAFNAVGTHGDDLVMLPPDVPLLQEAVMKTGAQLVVIDPFAAFLAPELNAMSDHSLRQATAPLAQMAQATGCAVIVVAHFRKSREGSPLTWVGGSVGLTGQARSVLILGRHKEYSPMTADERLLIHVKSNGSALASTLVCEVVPRFVEVDGLRIETSYIKQRHEDEKITPADVE